MYNIYIYILCYNSSYIQYVLVYDGSHIGFLHSPQRVPAKQMRVAGSVTPHLLQDNKSLDDNSFGMQTHPDSTWPL